MRIIVDAMGGDLAPKEIVLGALSAAKRGIPVTLVGRMDLMQRVLKEADAPLPSDLELVYAESIVEMHDDPVKVIRQKPDASMIVGLRLLAEGKGDAFVSAGSTGALLTAATLIVKRIRGIRRAAMGPILPSTKGRFVLMDCGANAECTPDFLLQFALMGSHYAEAVLSITRPRVALLNIGTEETKGGSLQREAFALLTEASKRGAINFVGNIEARDVLQGMADVVVADGFSGNILLKSIEGTALYFSGLLKGVFKKNLLTMLAAGICRGGIRSIKDCMDYRKTGGTAFIGLQKPVIKAHGASDRVAIENAIMQASRDAEKNIADSIRSSIQSGDEQP